MRKNGMALEMKAARTGSPLRDKSFKVDIRITSCVGWQVKEVHLSIEKFL